MFWRNRLGPAAFIPVFALSILIMGCPNPSAPVDAQGDGSGSGGAPEPANVPALVSLSVGPADQVVPLGSLRQFVATGTFDDGTARDVTTSVRWHSSDPGVAEVSSASGSEGLAAAVGSGSVMISASSGDVTASTSLIVRPWEVAAARQGLALQGIARSENRFVAVGGPAACILTSGDGETWTDLESSRDLEGVAWSGSVFTAVGPGCILTSPDGTTWTSRYDAPVVIGTGRGRGKRNGFHAVAWSGKRFVVVGSVGAVATSPNGEKWAKQTPYTGNDLNGNDLHAVVWSGTQFVAVGAAGTIVTSSDGIDWGLVQDSGSQDDLFGITWSGTQFVVVGWAAEGDGFSPGGSILTSSDGQHWTKSATGVTDSLRLSGIASYGKCFVAVGGQKSTAGGLPGDAILVSLDNGVTWTSESLPGLNELNGVACCGMRFAAVGEGGTILIAQAGEPKADPPKKPLGK